MALTKIKLNEVDTKATPVLSDSIVISDSENSGKGALVEITDLQTLIGGGGCVGAVDSVAGKTGVVTLDASDIAETAALKILTADERTKLAGISENAEVNTVDSVAGRTGDVTLDADDVAPTSTKLWMSDTQSSKLAGIAENANNYTHPASHPQSMIEGLADALAAKAAAADLSTHTGNTSNPHGVTKAQVGLENCDNTADTAKPVSTAQAAALALKAPLESPDLTGTPKAPTAAPGTNTTQIATTAFVQDALADISIDADPYSVKLTGNQSIGGTKTFTTSPVLPTPTAGDNTTKAATTAFVQAELAGKAPLASPALTGTPTAPTAAAGTNTTQLATTAFCGNFNQKWTYSYTGVGGAISASEWTMHAFGASGTLTLPLASSVASGVQVAAIVVTGGAEIVVTRSGSDQFVTPTGLATTYTLRGNGSSIVLVRVTASAWACIGAPDSLINEKAAGQLLTSGTMTETSTGSPGMIRYDAGNLYVCVAPDHWIFFEKGSWT